MSYRPEIDGLRAVAVLSVLAFHAFPDRVGGGYLGVDVFFVISGFLITRLLIQGLETGSFRVREFFARRVRRLFPALTLVLALVLVAGWWLLLPHEYAALGRYGAGSALFVANIVAWLDVGYFDAGADRKPLLHLWSLGVEEQFYIVWPFILMLAWRVRCHRLWLVAALGFGSLALWLALLRQAPESAFYLVVSRFWQVLAGAVLAVPGVASQLARVSLRSAEVLAGVGLALILSSVFAGRGSVGGPSLWAIAAVGGAALFIAVAPGAPRLRTALSARPLVTVGLISYPLYLWHWPLLTLLDLTHIQPLWGHRVAILAMSVALAWGTYRWLEQPIRSRRWTGATVPRLALALLLVAGAAAGIAANRGIESRLADSLYLQVNRGYSVVLPGTESCDADESPLTQCRTAGEPVVAIVGDSHADSLFFGFVNSGHARYARVLLMTRAGCQPALGGEPRVECAAFMRDTVERLRGRPGVEHVVITGYSEFAEGLDAVGLDAFVEGYAGFVDAVRALDKRVTFVIDVPAVPFEPDDCLRRRWFSGSSGVDPYCRTFTPAARPGYERFLARLASRLPDLDRFDPSPALCEGHECRLFVDGVPQYKDSGHLHHDGSVRVARAFIATGR